jgi:signal transduction histidine kinase/ActR/RegA family two-component response regulator
MSQSRRQRIDALHSQVDALAGSGRLESEDAAIIEQLVSELSVYKGELEVQNETLREALAALEASRARFERLFQQAPIGYAVLDTVGVIRAANEALVEMTQIPRTQLVGRFLYRCLTPDSASAFAMRLASLAGSQAGEMRALDAEIKTPEGTVPVRIILSWDAQEGDTGPCYLVAVVDMTLVRRREAELARALDAALAADRAKGEFLATMSHELRTPLNGILGMLQLLEDSGLTEEQRLYTAQAREASRHLVRLLSDILDFARLDAGHPEPVWERFRLQEDIFAPVYGALHLEAEGKGLYLRLEMAQGTPEVWIGDAGRSRQILLNIVGNAVKYTTQGGVVVQASASVGGLCFWVEDTGSGMDDATLEGLFEPFRRGHGKDILGVRGAGLGMAIVARLVRLLSGSLCVDTGPGAGTRMVAVVPARPGIAMAEAVAVDVAPPVAHPSQCGLRVRVLVAEDDAINRLVAVRLLRSRGYEVREAVDGVQTLEWLEEECFDVVLMDIQMPGLDGLETTRRIRASHKPYRHIAIVAMTAHTQEEDKRQALAAGMQGYVSKPFDIQEVEEAIALAMAQAAQEGSVV